MKTLPLTVQGVALAISPTSVAVPLAQIPSGKTGRAVKGQAEGGCLGLQVGGKQHPQ
ncbi:MAG: hypothetical protein HXX08_22585 [Chloroflexi bacterium]|uniref:Uncharacterized protein n=1 Tax=Candidatus Chlorohelix allophototropha TaxID=3003348 RepID=A0A8T7M915_9CHLR|nr:hypothetical protein [Chloroflexota bacterium]WJW68587.1 hypothetical protein OZ401_004201 [Chloroflexota bacterium L227-S17]